MVGSIFASCSSLLAASSRGGGGGDPSDVVKYILLWSGGLVVVIVLGMWAAAHLKRRYQQQQSDHPTAAAGFTLSDLRQLHRSGQMTDEEFERAKAKILGSAKAMTSKMPDPLARDGGKPPTQTGPPVDR